MSYHNSKKFNDLMSNMHNFSNSENTLKEILLHPIYLLAKYHNMNHDDAIQYVTSDCSEIDYPQT